MCVCVCVCVCVCARAVREIDPPRAYISPRIKDILSDSGEATNLSREAERTTHSHTGQLFDVIFVCESHWPSLYVFVHHMTVLSVWGGGERPLGWLLGPINFSSTGSSVYSFRLKDTLMYVPSSPPGLVLHSRGGGGGGGGGGGEREG